MIVIGYNPGWKQKVVLGKINNQNFVQIPFAKLHPIVSLWGKYKSKKDHSFVKLVLRK